MSVINTNVKALYTQAALKTTGRASAEAMQQLSTGKRINSAKDDAAGLAIATRMTQQIRSLNQAMRNAGDAVSLIQTTEGATSSITSMLQRMRELSIQAINDTNADDQRGYLDVAFQQLKQACEGLTQMAKMMGGTPPKVTYMKQCPKPAQGICANYLGSGRDAYYYARSAQEIADFPTACPKAGGRWLPGQ